MKTTLQDGLDALAKSLADVYPGTTGLQVRAVWDKITAGTALTVGFEHDAAEQIGMNRRTLDTLLAMEMGPNRETLEAQAEAALVTNRTARNQLIAWRTTGSGAGTGNLTAAQSSLALRTMADNQAAMLQQLNGIIRLVLRKLDGID
jgi:hypothetical protein